LDVLVGDWTVEAVVGGRSLSGGRMSAEWLEGGAFLVQRSDAEYPPETPREWVEHSPFPTSTITGADDTSEEFRVLYSDARGVFRIYRMTLDGKVWTMFRDAPGFVQRFTATIDGDTIAGRWDRSPDGVDWSLDFELVYRRVSNG
jgi:hypothetical protein